MRYLTIVVLSTLLVAGCSPNLTQLKSFKTAEAIHEKILLVIVPDDNDALIFEEYGQTKKAERLIRANEIERTMIMNAFTNEYSFSEVQFINELQMQDYNNKAYVTSRWDQRTVSDDREEMIYFGITINGDQPIQVGFNTHANFKKDYPRLIRLLNSRLQKLYKKGKALKAE